MNIKKCVDQVSTFLELKRTATEYVIDYRRLSQDELKAAVIKTAPQYYNPENIKKTVEFFELNPSRMSVLFMKYLFSMYF